MEARTVIERVEVETQTGNVSVRIVKEVVGDGGVVISCGYHRAMIGPHENPLAVLAGVTLHLKQMGFPEFLAEDVAVLDAVMAAAPIVELRKKKAAEPPLPVMA